jgi:hypothetical protein
MDLSSSLDEEDLIPDTSHDFEFAQHLYDELNRALLGSPSEGKIIILNDSNEEKEEVREEKSTDARDKAASAAVNPHPPPSIAPMLLWGQRMIIVMIRGPIRRLAVRMVVGMMPVSVTPTFCKNKIFVQIGVHIQL